MSRPKPSPSEPPCLLCGTKERPRRPFTISISGEARDGYVCSRCGAPVRAAWERLQRRPRAQRRRVVTDPSQKPVADM